MTQTTAQFARVRGSKPTCTNPKRKAFAPIFIVGFPRSGTTLLAVLLDRHPDIAVGPESHFFEVIKQLHLPHTLTPPELDDGLARILAAPRMRDLELSVDVVRLWLQPGSSVDAASILAAILQAYRAKRGKAIIAEKTPQHLLELDALLRWYPTSKVICMLRDGRDAVASMLQVPWRSHSSARLYALQWNRYFKLIESAQKRYPQRVLVVRYEDLASQPEPQLQRIGLFIGVQFDPAQLDATQESSAVPQWELGWKASAEAAPNQDYMGQWQTRLSTREQQIVKTTLHDSLRRAGYLSSEAPRPAGVTCNWTLARGFFRKIYLHIIRHSKTYQHRELQHPRSNGSDAAVVNGGR
ncbi:MAG: sulfotransferase [Phycisphaerales bacterium]|nr:sulfotransferase [Phycisphaerales bacterium]